MGQVRYFDFAYLFPKGHILIKLLFSVGLSLAGTYLFVKLINLNNGVGQVRYFDFAYLFPKGHILIKLLFSVGLSLAYLFVKLINLIKCFYLVVPLLIIAFFFANHFTIAGMGKDFSHNLGVSYEKIINIALFISSIDFG